MIDLVKESSSSIMFADLPPNSCETLFTVTADAVATATPPLVDPVNAVSYTHLTLTTTPYV